MQWAGYPLEIWIITAFTVSWVKFIVKFINILIIKLKVCNGYNKKIEIRVCQARIVYKLKRKIKRHKSKSYSYEKKIVIQVYFTRMSHTNNISKAHSYGFFLAIWVTLTLVVHTNNTHSYE